MFSIPNNLVTQDKFLILVKSHTVIIYGWRLLSLGFLWLWRTRKHSSEVVMRPMCCMMALFFNEIQSLSKHSPFLTLRTLLFHLRSSVQFCFLLSRPFMWLCHNIKRKPPLKPHLNSDLLHLFIKIKISNVIHNPTEMDYPVSNPFISKEPSYQTNHL